MCKSGIKRKRPCQADSLLLFRRTTVHPMMQVESIVDQVVQENALILLYAIIVCIVFYIACFLRFYEDVQLTIKRDVYVPVQKATPAMLCTRLLFGIETMHENYNIQ